MFVYARYHRTTALVAPSPEINEPLDERKAEHLARRLRRRYPLAGLKFWQQVEPNPTATGVWTELRASIYKTLQQPPDETPCEPPLLSEGQARAYLDVPHDRLRHEVNAGRLTWTGTQRHRRFAVSELDRWRELNSGG